MTKGLYPQLLGTAWQELGPSVRTMHCVGCTIRAHGRFRVRHGRHWLARCLLWLTRMPPAGEAMDVRLLVTEEHGGELWTRSFTGRPFLTRQRARGDGTLGERAAGLELRFRLAVEHGALVYHHFASALCLGPLRIPLPRWLGPRVTARETPGDGPNHTSILVHVGAPIGGLLISYEGDLFLDETPS